MTLRPLRRQSLLTFVIRVDQAELYVSRQAKSIKEPCVLIKGELEISELTGTVRAQQHKMMDRSPVLPVVTVHYAQSLDGRIATCTGESRWISSPETLMYAHTLRASHGAILVGVGTIAADDPRLTLRFVCGDQPRRVVLDSRLSIPLGAAVLNDCKRSSTVVLTTSQAPAERIEAVRAKGAEVVIVEAAENGRICLERALEVLARGGIDRLLVEGGGQTITSFLKAGLVSNLTVCIAPLVIGHGVSAVGDLGVLSLTDALRCRSGRWTPVGPDLIFEGEL